MRPHHRPILLLVALVALPAAALVAQLPIDCADRWQELEALRAADAAGSLEGEWQQFAEAVRTAEPGAQLYAPHPYPESSEEIVADFVYALEEVILCDSKPDDHSPAVWRLAAAASAGDLPAEVHRVESWLPYRCSLERPMPYYLMLRLLTADGERELGRAALHDTGLLARLRAYPGPMPRRDPPTLADAEAVVRRALGADARVEWARLVALAGLRTLEDPLEPRLAFTVDGRYYVLEDDDRLWELLYPEEAMTVTEFNAVYMSAPRALGWDPEAPIIVSTGYGWVRAHRVPVPRVD